MLNPPVNGKIQGYSRPLSVFQVLFKANIVFQVPFKTVLNIQVVFKPVQAMCVLEQDSLSSQPRKTRPVMTIKLLTWT